MSEQQLQNVIWMAEELDFDLVPPAQTAQAELMMWLFLQSAGNPELKHRIVRPSDNIDNLQANLQAVHTQDPFTTVIDLTRGKLSSRLTIGQDAIPTWGDFSMSRVRKASDPALPTSGHLISHNSVEIRQALSSAPTDHILVLDDTAFSGSTSAIIEDLVRNAFPEREIHFTHGFLILNTGELGPEPGPSKRIAALGSRAVGGMEIQTPRDDGWHFFDMVKSQGNLAEHLRGVLELVAALSDSNGQQHAVELLADPAMLKLIYPNVLSTSELVAAQNVGHFIAKQVVEDGHHTRNPQLLPAIIQQGHLSPPHEWRDGVPTTLSYLQQLSHIVEGSRRHA